MGKYHFRVTVLVLVYSISGSYSITPVSSKALTSISLVPRPWFSVQVVLAEAKLYSWLSVGAAGPVGPVGPAGPWMPCTPCDPVSPVSPLSPLGPVSPFIATSLTTLIRVWVLPTRRLFSVEPEVTFAASLNTLVPAASPVTIQFWCRVLREPFTLPELKVTVPPWLLPSA